MICVASTSGLVTAISFEVLKIYFDKFERQKHTCFLFFLISILVSFGNTNQNTSSVSTFKF
jgi:hypothetical protein